MEQIYPLTEQRIGVYAGMNVCAVLKTGFRQFGILERCSGDIVYLRLERERDSYAPEFHPIQPQYSLKSAELEKHREPDVVTKISGTKSGRTGRAKAASTTNYARQQRNPSSKISASGDKNVAKLELADIAFLLLLV